MTTQGIEARSAAVQAAATLTGKITEDQDLTRFFELADEILDYVLHSTAPSEGTYKGSEKR
jgi:hypothetical protein